MNGADTDNILLRLEAIERTNGVILADMKRLADADVVRRIDDMKCAICILSTNVDNLTTLAERAGHSPQMSVRLQVAAQIASGINVAHWHIETVADMALATADALIAASKEDRDNG
ncbi:MAG: hypothetical protein A3E01_02625 [Gammaproteobacteria bacterium RIFCSPHIGHO2_12_FULL_63_22]|nr:MAG: hypothetical protein A3E01_02625 [Gammaproteobacteria bacterium RIFCSPHIGHO2_12_FULL_63_22]